MCPPLSTVIIWGDETSSAHPGPLTAITLQMPMRQGCCLLEAQVVAQVGVWLQATVARCRSSIQTKRLLTVLIPSLSLLEEKS